MQVVYSGGTSTPMSSPRCYRKDMQGGGYTRPMAPGYALNNHYFHPPPSPLTIKKHYSKSKKSNQHDKSLRNFIPAMKKPVAITCLICNIFIPGLGTFISGLTLKCGSRVRIPDKSKSKIILTNTWVATLQFLTTFLLLLGWIWSVTWGVAFLTFSGVRLLS
uniref:Protein SPEC3 n=1 Tax=Octopus bimaculoides TaxID=37653 RepID=A0A0L8FPS9_OCTBM